LKSEPHPKKNKKSLQQIQTSPIERCLFRKRSRQLDEEDLIEIE
jgi:hypothetical protein